MTRPTCFTIVAALCAAVATIAHAQNPAGGAPATAPAAAPAAPTAPATGAPPIDATGMIDSLPPIQVSPEVLDFGFMAPKAGGRGTVTLTNTGTTPLTIAAITPSCKCTTTSSLAGAVIEPGKSVPLEAVLEGASMPQTHRASIRVLVEGYAKVLEIQLHGETAMPVRAVPALINAVEGKPHQGRFVIESIDKQPFTICSIGGRAPEFLGFSAGNAPRSTYLVKYDLDAWQPTFPAYLVVETDRADCPVFDVWVRSEETIPKSNMRMKEYRVNAGRIPMGGSVDLSVDMDDAGDEVLAAESLNEDVQVEMLGQVVDGKNRRINLRVTPRGPQQGLMYGTMKLYTRDKEQSLVLFGSVRPATATGCEGCRADRIGTTPAGSATDAPAVRPPQPRKPVAPTTTGAPKPGAPGAPSLTPATPAAPATPATAR